MHASALARGLLFGLMLLIQRAGPSDPVILLRGDIEREMDSFGLPAKRAMAAAGWLGLYERNAEWRLAHAAVEIVPRTLSEIDEDYVVHDVSSDPADAWMLLSGFPDLAPGPARTVGWRVDLSPSADDFRSSEVDIVLGEDRYTVRVESEEASRCDTVITLVERGREQLLFSPGSEHAAIPVDFGCDEPHFSILWAGDLDGDGRLDLLVTLSWKYSYHPRQLLLSSRAAADELVSLAGTYVPHE
jgi:hypothetical protein